MEELIKLDSKNQEFPIDARELHEKLKVGRDFSNWIKGRIEEYKFTEGIDFSPILAKNKKGRPAVEYKLTLDMGKELAMVENNDEGQRMRRYFIAVEKNWRETHTTTLIGKVVRRELTDALRDSGLNDKMHGWGYKTFTDLIYKLVLGVNSKQYRDMFGLPKEADIRNYLNGYQKQEVARLENASQGMINIGMDYEEVKRVLSEKFLDKPKLIAIKQAP
jgi:phage anti-repressor protein